MEFSHEMLPELFEGIRKSKSTSTFDHNYVLSAAKGDIAQITYLGKNEWRIFIDNFPGQKKFFQTNFPITTVEQFTTEMSRIGLDLILVNAPVKSFITTGMKKSIELENLKTVLFAPYLFQEVFIPKELNCPVLFEVRHLGALDIKDKLFLKHLDELSDDHAIQIAKILYPNDKYAWTAEYGKYYIKYVFRDSSKGWMKAELYEFLQLNGYDVPHRLLEYKTFKEVGWTV